MFLSGDYHSTITNKGFNIQFNIKILIFHFPNSLQLKTETWVYCFPKRLYFVLPYKGFRLLLNANSLLFGKECLAYSSQTTQIFYYFTQMLHSTLHKETQLYSFSQNLLNYKAKRLKLVIICIRIHFKNLYTTMQYRKRISDKL